MSKKEKYKILMLGKPGGTLARTYNWHIQALNLDKKQRYDVEDINIITNNFKNNIDIKKYDIFWFYAKAFHPNLYEQVKNSRPDAKLICGPNILLDKPDVGLSDAWDEWYVQNANPDLHLDQVKYYSDHVNKFLSNDLKKKSRCLDKCMLIDDQFYDKDTNKKYSCLLYSKKRRYDLKFESFRDGIVDLLNRNNITYVEFKSGKFGSYERKDYFKALNEVKVTVNLSLDECPGILNYESMFFNVPVIGSNHNTPVTSCPELIVKNSDRMTENYLVRNENAHELYFKKIQWFLKNELEIKTDHREWIRDHTSFEKYADNVHILIKGLYSEN